MTEEYLPYVSIIIVNYNGKHHLKECLNSLLQIFYPKDRFEVIIVDNKSSDGSVEFIRENFPWVRVIKLDRNYGFAEANNKAVKVAKGGYLAFLNNDVVVEKDWLIELVKLAIKDNNTIYSSKMLRYDKKDVVIYSGSKMLAWGMPLALNVYEKNRNEKKPIYTFYADGAGMLIKKELFLTLGGFDSSYFIYSEDWDLSWRAWLHGYKVVCVPTSKYYHKISSTFGRRSLQYIYLLWRNVLLTIVKNAEFKNVIKMLILHMAWSIATYFLIFFKEKKYSLMTSILKAYVAFILRLPDTLQKRKIIQLKRRVSDKKLYEKSLILSLNDSIKESIRFLRKKELYENE